MRPKSHTLTSLLCAAATALVSNCSTKTVHEVQEREDEKTSSYKDRQEKREIRIEARQERSNARFDRIMGEPVKSSDTGLRLPQ